MYDWNYSRKPSKQSCYLVEITLGQELAVPDSSSGLVLTNCVILVNLCHLFVSCFFFFLVGEMRM